MQNLFIPQEEDFKSWIRESFREELKEALIRLKEIPDPNQEPLLTRKEIGKYLRISLVTLTDWKKRGLPCHQKGGRVLFLKSEVLNWLKDTRIVEG
jgi:excisionase family DNA binding protein